MSFGYTITADALDASTLTSDLQALVPAVDDAYQFDAATTDAIMAGFVHNRRVLLQGLHGTGKSSHVMQVAARLNWPLMRVNLDGHISRVDLIGRDMIVLRDGLQVTEFVEGMLPWAMQRPIALVFDEYDAARADVMFVIQRLLEAEGHLTLLDQNRVITPHPQFRLFATANTIGLGDATGLYHGTNPINAGQMDRWQIVATLDYLQPDVEVAIVAAKVPVLAQTDAALIRRMVEYAALTRVGFAAGDVSTLMSPRAVLHWAENTLIFAQAEQATERAFALSFLNKCDESEREIFAEYYERVFDVLLPQLHASHAA